MRASRSEKRRRALRRACYRRTLMRGRREAHKRGLDVMLVGVNFDRWVGWEAWHASDVMTNLREFYRYGIMQ